MSDPESRQIIVCNNITEVAYSVQTTVDAKNCIPIDYKVTNQNDSKAMDNMVQRAKSILRNNQFTALFDKGYHNAHNAQDQKTGELFQEVHLQNITKRIGRLIRIKNTSMRDGRLLLNIRLEQ